MNAKALPAVRKGLPVNWGVPFIEQTKYAKGKDFCFGAIRSGISEKKLGRYFLE